MVATNYEELAQAVEGMREMVAAMVAGLITDGFTDEQARQIVTGVWASAAKKGEGS